MCAPTGSGKTVMFSFMASEAIKRGNKVLILTDRIELYQQANSTLKKQGLNPKDINDLAGGVHVFMIQTLLRRYQKTEVKEYFKTLDLIIIDEAHKTIFDKLFNNTAASTRIIGATATPFRKGAQAGLDSFYHKIVDKVSVKNLVDLGHLAKCTTYGFKVDLSGVTMKKGDYNEGELAQLFSSTQLFKGVFSNYKRLCYGEKTLIFAPNREASEELVKEFVAKGVAARHVDCYMSKTERAEVLQWFKITPSAVLSNYGILTTGFDETTIKAVILYRATKSLVLFLQMVGRGSRIKPENSFKLLDFGNNITTHGFWQDPREWQLEKKKRKLGAAAIKECPKCNAMLNANAKICTECGYKYPEPKKKVDKNAVNLELLEPNQKHIGKLINYAISKGYKAGWVVHQLKTKKELEDYAKIKGFKNGWAYRVQNTARNY
jgi:superfamily II DNA or RNA helicase